MADTQLQEQWRAAQVWERAWWLNNQQMHAVEIRKGDTVANWLNIGDVSQLRVLDIGCGPFSILQRRRAAYGVAVDPIDYGPLEQPYQALGIQRLLRRGEDLLEKTTEQFDEAWVYNCLQHVESPEQVLRNAMQLAKRVRLFEWINIPPYEGHLHMLTSERLAQPFRAAGWHDDLVMVGAADADGLNGTFLVGVFTR
jgi:2-polyprenyl-3-methyl-5-hydroxy-6-metoxy-1,4-benzoquinol methylase